MASTTIEKGRRSSKMFVILFLCLRFGLTTSSSSFKKERSSYQPSPMYPSLRTIQPLTYQNVSSTITPSPPQSLLKSNHKTTKHRHSNDNIDYFLSDLRKLEDMVGKAPVLDRTHSKKDSSYTKSWTDADWELHQIKSFQRYVKHMRSWITSSTFHSVLPTVTGTFLWTVCCIVAVQNQFFQDVVHQAPFSHSISSFTSPISILLALKTNRALDRLFEARSVWGKMIRICSSLGGMAVNYIAPIDEEQGVLMGRYLAAFGWCMKGKLRGEDDTLVLRTLLPYSELKWMESCRRDSGGVIDSVSFIIFRLRSIVANITNRADGKLSIAASEIIEQRLGELESSVGICAKIVASPIPPTFTRMTSRVLCLFLWCLPLALVSSGMESPIAILVIVTFLSYIFVGIDEIGVELEYPFPLLPMFSLAMNLKSAVGNQFKMMKGMRRWTTPMDHRYSE